MAIKQAIAFHNVGKSFGDQVIVEGLDLKIAQGEFVSILGPSGCGKSTLLKMMAGLESVDSGRIEIDSIGEARNKIGFVFQESNLLPWLTSFENVALPYRITRQKIDREKILNTLRMVGLDESSLRKYPKQLSGGMKMRVSIARSLILDPEILLLDEPFAALDDLLRTSLNLELVKIWKRDRLTTLFVTHNISEALFMSQKILIMKPAGQEFELVEVPFDYPRETKIRTSNKFAKLFAQVSSLLEANRESAAVE